MLSFRLTRVSRLEHDRRICQKCSRVDHGTCKACARHRLLQQAPDGRLLCKTCIQKGEVYCQKCQDLMPAGQGRQCRRCYWRSLLEKRIQMDGLAFSSPEMVAHFVNFGNWLREETGERKAAIKIHRYLPFFMEIERQWRNIPDYLMLLTHFGARKLRSVLLPVRWMRATGLVVPDETAKVNDSNRRHISATLLRFTQGTQEQSLLENYHKILMEGLQVGKITLHSVRMALSSAASLLCYASEIERMPPDQCVLNTYLIKSPGQRASVSGFVRYLCKELGIEIALPEHDPERTQRQRRKKQEIELIALMREGCDNDEYIRRWLAVALAYFHGLPKGVVKSNWKNFLHHSDNGEGWVFRWNEQDYWLPMYPAASIQQ